MDKQTPIRLYDSVTSPNCHRVKVVLEEKQLPYRMIPVDLKAGEQKKPDLAKAELARALKIAPNYTEARQLLEHLQNGNSQSKTP